VPARRLRELQASAHDAITYGAVTNSYVESVKKNSVYWTKINKQTGN
jgi:hypothetical protein